MYQIGEFARFGHVTVRQLRHYDALNLLEPAYTDSKTGYRYYRAHQLSDLNRIVALQRLGFDLKQVRNLLAEDITPGELRAMLSVKRHEAEQAMARERTRIQDIESRIDEIESAAPLMPDQVVMKPLQGLKHFAVRGRFSRVGAIQLARHLHAATPDLTVEARGAFMAVDDGDAVTLGFQVDDDFDADRVLRVAEGLTMRVYPLRPHATALTTIRIGYPNVASTDDSDLARWAASRGYERSGATRIVFIEPAPPSQIENRVTEIQYPVFSR